MQEMSPDTAGPPDPYPAPPATATPACSQGGQPAPAGTRPPPPPESAALHLIRSLIRQNGPLRFDRFVEVALYHPEHGYYARQASAVGRRGDFFTSVSVGPTFAALLARRFLAWWLDAGKPRRWRVVETGAHDATLACDLIAALASLAGLAPPEYTIVEPLAPLRERQQHSLSHTAARVLDSATPLAADPLPGFVLANEVLDALPCRLAIARRGRWFERFVTLKPDHSLGFVELPLEDPAPLPAPPRLPDGYLTEFRGNYRGFLRPLRDALRHGRLLFLDYGFARPEYFDPLRTTGTLRTYHRHQAGDDPLPAPGEHDITAHVNFTDVAEAALALDLGPACFEPQGPFLIRHGQAWLETLAGLTEANRQAAVRQFHTLTHPAHLGLRFHALELAWREPCDPVPAALARRRLALDDGPRKPA